MGGLSFGRDILKERKFAENPPSPWDFTSVMKNLFDMQITMGKLKKSHAKFLHSMTYFDTENSEKLQKNWKNPQSGYCKKSPHWGFTENPLTGGLPTH